jgi:hypothetical protein
MVTDNWHVVTICTDHLVRTTIRLQTLQGYATTLKGGLKISPAAGINSKSCAPAMENKMA